MNENSYYFEIYYLLLKFWLNVKSYKEVINSLSEFGYMIKYDWIEWFTKLQKNRLVLSKAKASKLCSVFDGKPSQC